MNIRCNANSIQEDKDVQKVDFFFFCFGFVFVKTFLLLDLPIEFPQENCNRSRTNRELKSGPRGTKPPSHSLGSSMGKYIVCHDAQQLNSQSFSLTSGALWYTCKHQPRKHFHQSNLLCRATYPSLLKSYPKAYLCLFWFCVLQPSLCFVELK